MYRISSSERVVNIKFWPRFKPTFPGALKLPMCYYIPVTVPSKLSNRSVLSCRTLYEVLVSGVGHEAFMFLSHWSALCRHTGVTIPLSSQTRTTSMTLLAQLVQIWHHNMFPRLTYPIFSNLYFHISFHVMLISTGSLNNTPTLVYYRSFCFGETLLKNWFYSCK